MSLLGPSLHHFAQQSCSREGAVHHKPCTARVTAATVAATTLDTLLGEAPGHVTGFADDSPRGQISSLPASPEEKLSISFPSLLRNPVISLQGFFSCISSEETFGEKIPGLRFIASRYSDKNAPFTKYKGAPRAYVTAGPTSEGGGGSVASLRRPDTARGSRPSRAGPRGPPAGSRAAAARGEARDGRGHWAAAPTWSGAGTCGRGGAGPGVGPPCSFPRRPPPPAPHLRAVLQRLLDGQLVDSRHRGGGRAVAGDTAAAHSSLLPPARLQQLTPTRPLSQARPPSPPAQLSPGA